MPTGPIAGAAMVLALALTGGAVTASATRSDQPTRTAAEIARAQAHVRAAALERADRSRADRLEQQQVRYVRARQQWQARQTRVQRDLERTAARTLGKPTPIRLPKRVKGEVMVTEPDGTALAGKTFAYVLPVNSGVTHDTFGDTGPYWVARHTGQDFPVPLGTPVKAVSSGVVLEAAWAGAYGNRVRLLLDDGTEIWYCHLSSFLARAGERVDVGQVVALSGSTGNSTGPHMHMEVHPNQQKTAIDPLHWLRAKGLRI